jgi:hypothetical protein
MENHDYLLLYLQIDNLMKMSSILGKDTYIQRKSL